MKKILMVLLLTSLASLSVFAECSDADKKALEVFDHAWGKAGETGDKAALMGIYAEDYVGLPGMLNKTTTIDNTMRTFERNKANPAGADKISYSHYLITCTPMSATITHRNSIWTQEGTGGKPESFYTRSIHILEKRNGKWQVVSNAGGSGLDDYDVLWYLEQDWNDAVLTKNKEWFEKNYASDFASVSSETATRFNKAEDIADTMDPALSFDAVDTTDMNIRIDGNYALVTGVFHTKGKGAKGPFDRRIRYTDAWIRRDGRWQAWSSQGTIIPAAPAVAQK